MVVEGWTEAVYWGFIRSALRKAWQKFPNRYKTLALAKVERGKYSCNECKEIFSAKEVVVDHIVPCGSLRCFEDLAEFCRRLFCTMMGLQVLCKTCHQTKTLHERGMTDDDIALAQFRKLSASMQRMALGDLNVRNPGVNKDERERQFRELSKDE